MTKQNIIPMDGKLYPVGTLMYIDVKKPDGSTDWKPHRSVWRVIAHRECQNFPDAPITIRNEIRFVYYGELND